MPHLDLGAVEHALQESRAQVRWVATESYFSMDGDGPDLRALADLCRRHGAGLIVDEAHALGVFGPEGAGRCAEGGVTRTSSSGHSGKPSGCTGRSLPESDRLRTFLWNRARSFVFSTAPSPILTGLAMLHVKQLRRADSERKRLAALTHELRRRTPQAGTISARGLLRSHRSGSPLAPTSAHSKPLTSSGPKGFWTQAIRPPTVPPGTARLRVTVTASLASTQVRRLAEALARTVGTEARGSATQPDKRRAALRRSGSSFSGLGLAVGKTRVGAAIARALRARGAAVLALKPVESGVPLGAVGEDALELAAAAGHPVPAGAATLREPLSLISPLNGKGGDSSSTRWQAGPSTKRHRSAPLTRKGWTLLETAGGVLSPLSPTRDQLRPRTPPGASSLDLGRAGCTRRPPRTLRHPGSDAGARAYSGPDCAERGPWADLSTGSNGEELARLGIAQPVAVMQRDRDDGVEALVDRLLASSVGLARGQPAVLEAYASRLQAAPPGSARGSPPPPRARSRAARARPSRGARGSPRSRPVHGSSRQENPRVVDERSSEGDSLPLPARSVPTRRSASAVAPTRSATRAHAERTSMP